MPKSKDDCWEAKYRNDSRPWLIGSTEVITHPPSTTKDAFGPVEPLPKQTNGRRKELLEKFLYQKVRDELKQEMIKDPEDEDNASEYKNSFCDSLNFSETKDEKDNDLILMHPLYMDAPQTFWMERLKTVPGKTETPGSKPIAAFRKNASFSKPINEVMDDQKPGTIGYL